MKKTFIRITCFFMILLLILGCWNAVFRFKYGDGIYGMTRFYELPENSVDVIILGSSHAYESFNTGTLWDEYGIASYVLSGPTQPVWNSYYYLKEALKTQQPSLVILEGYCTVMAQDYFDDSTIIKNNFGLRWSADKTASLKASVPEDRQLSFLLEYTQYHNRYTDLKKDDFQDHLGDPFYADFNGFFCNMVTEPFEHREVHGVTEKSPLYEKTEQYYRDILALAQENNIPVLVVIAPFPGADAGIEKVLNATGDIATSMGVPFLNCTLMTEEIGIDFATDAADVSHLNFRGNRKFSNYIGQYLKEHYDIPDRRGDSDYDSWQRQADFIRQMIADQELSECTVFADITTRLTNPVYRIVVSVDGYCNPSDETILGLLSEMGVSGDVPSDIRYLEGNTALWHSGTNEFIIDQESLRCVTNGINVVVFDTLTEKVADAFGLDADNGYAIVR